MTLPKGLAEAILQKAAEVKSDPTRFKSYADDPIGFARDILGIRRQKNQPVEFFPDDCGLWTAQQSLLLAARDHDRVTCKSGHMTGKSFSMAVLIAWWHFARQGRVISTGPTKTHIEDVLWPEIHELNRRSLVPLPGQLDKLDWKQDAYWYATGITTDKPGAFQGRHHPRLGIVVDEAAAVDDFIHTEIDTCAGAEGNMVFRVGNPTVTSGAFYEGFKQPDVWFPLTISCLDHPNVLSGEELIPGAVSRKQVERWRTEWGEQHPYWFSRVLGQFPVISEKGVIPLLWMERAQNEDKRQDALKQADKERIPRVASLDVARYGQNKCVLLIRKGDAVEHVESWGHTSTMETIGIAIERQRQWGFKVLVVDSSGIGAPVADRLFEQQLPFAVHAYVGGSRAGRQRMYSNRRSEMWMHTRLRLEKQRLWFPVAARNAEIEHLCADLVRPEYHLTSAGKFQVETKEALMDRGVKSPDWGDALTMSFAVADDPDAELEAQISDNQDPEAFREINDGPSKRQDETFEQLPAGYGVGGQHDPEAGDSGQF